MLAWVLFCKGSVRRLPLRSPDFCVPVSWVSGRVAVLGAGHVGRLAPRQALTEAGLTSPAARAQVEQPEGEVIDLSAIPSPRASGAAALLPFWLVVALPATKVYMPCLLTFQPARGATRRGCLEPSSVPGHTQQPALVLQLCCAFVETTLAGI
jgi:hypothetical protein